MISSSTLASVSRRNASEENKQVMDVTEEIANLLYTIEQAIQRVQTSSAVIPQIETLNDEMEEGLKDSEEKIKALEQYCEEKITLPSLYCTTFDRVLERTLGLKKQIATLKIKLRKAVQIYKNKAETSKLKRETLLQSGLQPAKRLNQDGRAVSRQSRKVTESLFRTRSIISSNIDRASSSMEKLSESSSIFQNAIKTQEGYQDKVTQSTNIIRELKWKEKRDHFITLACFLFYILVVLYVFNRRLPIFSFVYYILGLVWSLVSSIFSLVGLGGDSSSTLQETMVAE